MRKVFNIKNGPSKDQLFEALRLRTAFSPQPIEFMIAERNFKGDNDGYDEDPVIERHRFHVTALEFESGEGQSWNIKLQSEDYQKSFSGNFNTESREGYMELKTS